MRKTTYKKLASGLLFSGLALAAVFAKPPVLAQAAAQGFVTAAQDEDYIEGFESMEPTKQRMIAAEFATSTKGYHYDKKSKKWSLYVYAGKDKDGKETFAPAKSDKTGWQTIKGKNADGKEVEGYDQTAYFLSEDEVAAPYTKQEGYFGYGYPNYPAVQLEAVKRGIDVSKWQGKIDWKKVKDDDVNFAFIRAGHGTRENNQIVFAADPRFVENMKGALDQNIATGVYLYSMAVTPEEAREEARKTVDLVQGYSLRMPIAYDLEDAVQEKLTPKQKTELILAFCDEVRASGYTPLLYINNTWLKNGLVNVKTLQDAGIDFWVARYGYLYNPEFAPVIWQGSSMAHVDGITENTVDMDFMLQDVFSNIGARTYAKEGWAHGKDWYYRDGKGDYITNSWKKVGNTSYYFDKNGKMATGWLQLKENWYYLKSWGGMATGWCNDGRNWYYMKSDGTMRTGWLDLEHERYYLKSWGAMAAGWYKIDGSWYYFHKSGAMLTGWVRVGSKWYYLQEDGKMKTGWFKDKNRWYYLNSSGAMLTGKHQIDGKWYTFNSWGGLI